MATARASDYPALSTELADFEYQRAPVILCGMTKPPATSSENVVRDSKSGRYVTVRGAGALKGHLTIKKGLDLTKPIASQALKGSGRPQCRTASAKG